MEDESFEATCSRVALEEVGIDVSVLGTLALPYLWRPGEHPYGRPLSIYTIVRSLGIIQETDTRRFFGPNELPDNIVKVHRRFIEQHLFLV